MEISNQFKKKIEITIRNIQKIASNHTNIGVSISGGKDSTAMYYLCKEALGNNFTAFYMDSCGAYPDTKEILKKLNCKIIKSDVTYWDCWKLEPVTDDFLNKVIVYDNAKKAVKELKLDLVMVGIRADESKNRKQRFKSYQNYKYTKLTNVFQYSPLEKWTANEVWDYLEYNNLPINGIYKKQAEMFGDNYRNYRVDSYLERISVAKGSIKIIQKYYPELFKEILEKAPNILTSQYYQNF